MDGEGGHKGTVGAACELCFAVAWPIRGADEERRAGMSSEDARAPARTISPAATADAPAASPPFPLGPLAATLAVQTLATAAAYSIPAVAPAIARDLGINPALVGVYISAVYGVGIFSALVSPTSS